MEINKDITKGYQTLPENADLPQGNEDCICCWGEGEVQCSFGDSYYYDTCYCVLVKYWKNIGNKSVSYTHLTLPTKA